VSISTARRDSPEVCSLLLAYALGAGEFGTLEPVDPVEEALVKIDRLTAQEHRVVREALRAMIPACSRRVEGPLAGALLMARVEEAVRDLCAELVRDARDQHGLTWSQIGDAFGVRMQSAQWRFSGSTRKAITRMRR
jgi:hypothetical protein